MVVKRKTTSAVLTGDHQLRYSHNQFLVFDSHEQAPGCQWEGGHWDQGFVKRESIVAFATLDQAGRANLSLVDAAETEGGIIRAIETSINVPSGKVCIEGVDEYPTSRYVKLAPGIYRVTASQGRGEGGQVQVFLSFATCAEDRPSKVIMSDDLLTPPAILLETSELP
jgi:Competence protein J (ComJ)